MTLDVLICRCQKLQPIQAGIHQKTTNSILPTTLQMTKATAITGSPDYPLPDQQHATGRWQQPIVPQICQSFPARTSPIQLRPHWQAKGRQLYGQQLLTATINVMLCHAWLQHGGVCMLTNHAGAFA